MRSLVASLCLVAVSACYQDSPTAPGPVNREVTLAPGQSASVAGAGLTIKFNGVTGDSRCPADAICITGGSANVHLELRGSDGARQEVTFETGNPQPVKFTTLTLDLTQLAPYPFISRPIQPGDYRATITVKR
ncbi:MAG: hypothetical protein H0W08_07185 [Acidobacteria bacterium]|nr:hypothetical protein [Acidobacteriota bacterium]